jgi:Ca-activated chloride channel family protein
MIFALPKMFWFLLVPAALAAWDIARRRRRGKADHPNILRAEAGPSSVELTPERSGRAADGVPRLRPWLWFGLALAAVALARPQWGRIEEPVFDQSREILLAVDLSRSMLATDVSPSRLDRAKLLIQSLLEKLAGERVGLVVFAGTSFLQAPLSADYEILREFLPGLNPGFLPEFGTNYGAMLDAAAQAFGTTGAADRFLIVLSDGEATDPAWKERIEPLKKRGIRVIGLGVGTPGGGMIPESDGSFLKDDRGAVVLSRLEPATLQELARATEGVYRDASAWIDVAGLVNETIERGRRGEFVETNTVRQVERFQWPLALAFWCLLVSLYHEFPVRPKSRAVTLRSAKSSAPTAAAALALMLLALGGSDLVAAAKLANPGSSSPNAAAAMPAEAPPGDPAALGRIVGRLSSAAKPAARDWAELAGETLNWGSRLQSQGQPVLPGPVHDAIAGVKLGEKLDAKAADWGKLRGDLEALLDEKEREDKKDDQKQDKNEDQKKSDEQQQQDQQKDQQSEQQKNDQQQQKQQNQQEKSQEQKDSSQQQQDQAQRKSDEESALGDMTKKDQPPPPPPENMQQVGGAPERKSEDQQEKADPALALPLQKLDQLRNQDSPAQLFQMMEGDRKGERKNTPRTSKTW